MNTTTPASDFHVTFELVESTNRVLGDYYNFSVTKNGKLMIKDHLPVRLFKIGVTPDHLTKKIQECVDKNGTFYIEDVSAIILECMEPHFITDNFRWVVGGIVATTALGLLAIVFFL